ncbi:NUDIX domain-containing protein [Dyadobacter luticola]|uniref:NUDIX domain-containing protein n=1 Tax=Dyadobacter luticola TaxID=1979387 RepID=A0A5R9L4J3_9BACT|nr:NUDIX domain-containing protein [Dyadobacter luticola]TLV03200.1 NUDIX domain-containing protein [Dyadobacter luticola]
MPEKSAGILMYRRGKEVEVLLVHPGGPFFVRKDEGSWSIPKGLYLAPEEPLAAAIREFEEETGANVEGNFIPLSPVKLKSGKIVLAWAVEGDFDTQKLVSNTFDTEWPPRSGKRQTFPEVDRADWFTFEIARKKLNERQVAFVDELEKLLD